MFVLSSDDDLIRKVTYFYSAVTSFISSSLIFTLLLTKSYLWLGDRIIFPLFLFLIAFEIFKWCFYVIIYKPEYTVKRKQIFRVLYEHINCVDIVRSAVIILLSCLGFYVIAVLFGAQLLNNQEETLMFSLLVTHLTVLPISIQFGSFTVEDFIQQVPPNNKFSALLYSNSKYTLIGAWFGAFVIPLDWDRPWQVWPIPCSLGALIGYSVSNYICFIQMIFINYRISFKKFI